MRELIEGLRAGSRLGWAFGTDRPGSLAALRRRLRASEDEERSLADRRAAARKEVAAARKELRDGLEAGYAEHLAALSARLYAWVDREGERAGVPGADDLGRHERVLDGLRRVSADREAASELIALLVGYLGRRESAGRADQQAGPSGARARPSDGHSEPAAPLGQSTGSGSGRRASAAGSPSSESSA